MTEAATSTSTVSLPGFAGPAPTNYEEIRESVGLALAHEDIPEDTISTVIKTVDNAVVQNEGHLQWGESSSTPSESAPTGRVPVTQYQVSGVPEEAVAYAFDRIGDSGIGLLMEDYVECPRGDALSLDYGRQSITHHSRTAVEQALRTAIDEKLASMHYEIQHGERDDCDVAEIRYARQNVRFELTRYRD